MELSSDQVLSIYPSLSHRPRTSARDVGLFLCVLLFLACTISDLGRIQAARFAPSALNDTNAQSNLLPVPPRHDQAIVRSALEAKFNKTYSGRVNPFTINSFLNLLLTSAKDPQKHPVRYYVAMQLVLRLGPTFNYFPQAQTAIRRLSNNYQVNQCKLQAQAIHYWSVSRWLTYNAVAANLWAASLWSGQAMRQGHFDSAKSMATDGLRMAIRFQLFREAAKLRNLLARIKLVRPLEKSYLAAKKILLNHPNNPQANQTVGLYRIATRGYISAGAKYLELSADPAWRRLGKLGRMDFLNNPPVPPLPQLQAATLWWSESKRSPANPYYAAQMRAMARWCFNSAVPVLNPGFLSLLAKGHYHKAASMMNDAIVFASHKKNLRLPVAKRVKNWKQMLLDLRQLRKKFTSAMATISAGSATPQLNEAIGEYLCFGEGRWKVGLVYLSNGNQSIIRRTARMDKALPVRPEVQLATGHAWWRLAREKTGLEKLNLEMRAAHWFKLALSKLRGNERKRVQYHLLHYATLLKNY